MVYKRYAKPRLLSRASFTNSIQQDPEPTKRYMSKLGPVTEYIDGSIKIDNYRGKGGTFYLSDNKERHIELDSARNKIRSSADREPYTPKRGEEKILRHKDGTLEYYAKLKTNGPNAEEYVILKITYPDGICVAFYRKPKLDYCRELDYLIDSINNIDEEVINKLKNYPNLIKQQNPVLGTPLSAAVKRLLMGGLTQQQSLKLIEVIKYLLEAGADPTIADPQGNKPITLLVSYLMDAINSINDSEVIALLTPFLRTKRLREFTNTAINTAKAETGDTPLLIAVKRLLMNGFTPEQSSKLIEIIRSLLQAGADPNGADKQGNTPLSVTVKKALMSGLTPEQFLKLIKIIRYLLEAGADPTIADIQGNTPITLSASKPDLLQVFMKAAGQPIFPAIAKADKNAVISFLSRMQQKSNINTMRNHEGQTPLVYAFTLALQTYNQMKQAQEYAAEGKNMVEKEKRKASATRLKALYENIKAWEARASAKHTQFRDFMGVAQALIDAGATLNNESGKEFLEDNGTEYRTILSPLLEI